MNKFRLCKLSLSFAATVIIVAAVYAAIVNVGVILDTFASTCNFILGGVPPVSIESIFVGSVWVLGPFCGVWLFCYEVYGGGIKYPKWMGPNVFDLFVHIGFYVCMCGVAWILYVHFIMLATPEHTTLEPFTINPMSWLIAPAGYMFGWLYKSKYFRVCNRFKKPE